MKSKPNCQDSNSNTQDHLIWAKVSFRDVCVYCGLLFKKHGDPFLRFLIVYNFLQ